MTADVDSFSAPVVSGFGCCDCLASDTRLDGGGTGFLAVTSLGTGTVFVSVTLLVEPELLRRAVGSCELDDSESELDELLSEPLELPLDDEESDVDPELDSVLVDYRKRKIVIINDDYGHLQAISTDYI